MLQGTHLSKKLSLVGFKRHPRVMKAETLRLRGALIVYRRSKMRCPFYPDLCACYVSQSLGVEDVMGGGDATVVSCPPSTPRNAGHSHVHDL